MIPDRVATIAADPAVNAVVRVAAAILAAVTARAVTAGAAEGRVRTADAVCRRVPAVVPAKSASGR